MFPIYALVLSFIAIIVGFYYVWSLWNFSYWQRKGVHGPKPIPIFGNIKDVVLQRKNMGMYCSEQYTERKSFPFTGFYAFHGHSLILNDLDLIRSILTKDFVHFPDHGMRVNEKKDPLAMHLFNASGEKWKNLRAKLTPTFTTSKIKGMFETVSQCNIEMVEYLQKYLEKDDIIDVKDLLATLNTDVIGSCAFGIDCNSFKHPDAEFRAWGRRIFKLTFKRVFLRALNTFMPGLMKKLNIGFTNQEMTDFFYNTVDSTIKYREENNITRNDFLQLLIQLKKDAYMEDESGKKVPDDGTRLTTMQIAAQVFVFFIAGFETSSTAASLALYELALNPDIQEKLHEEIDEVLGRHEGKPTYDNLLEMTYLNKVVEETLRKYPPATTIPRKCVKNYTIPGTDVTIEKDTVVFIPVFGIHRNPDYYPNPLKFDPERFSPEQKATRHNFAYIPFGEGPRICIGMRFGMMQTKLGLVSLLSKYTFSVCAKTEIPLQYETKASILTAKNGVWLKLTRRKQ